jgi:predicted transcriptional regulator
MNDVEERIDAETAKITYEELGKRHDELDEILSEFEEKSNTDELDSYKFLKGRMARMRKMRGILKEFF